MDCRAVGCAAHNSVKHVKLAHKVTLADAPNRGIARHLPDVLGPECQQPNARSATGGRGRSLTSGMAGPDYQNVVHSGALTG
jgi:hypothetical protein